MDLRGKAYSGPLFCVCDDFDVRFLLYVNKDMESLNMTCFHDFDNPSAGQVIGIHSINDLESKLNAASRTARLAIMYFTATWCGPCRFIAPVFISLASKYPRVVFLKIDIDEASDVAQRWHVTSVPTFFFIKDGKEVDKVVGADKNLLEMKIAQHAA